MSILGLIRKPYVKSEISIHIRRLPSQIATSVRESLKNGYIKTNGGHSAHIYEVFCNHFTMPIVRIPSTGRGGAGVRVDFGTFGKPKALIDVLDELFQVEVIAAKMVHGDPVLPSYVKLSERRAIKPSREMGMSYAYYSFMNTKPDWARTIATGLAGSPRWQENRTRAIQTFNAGILTVIHN